MLVFQLSHQATKLKNAVDSVHKPSLVVRIFLAF